SSTPSALLSTDQGHSPAPPPFPTRRSSDLYGRARRPLHRRWPLWRRSQGNRRRRPCHRGERQSQSRPRRRGFRREGRGLGAADRSEEHTSELQSRENIVCRLLLEKKKRARA